MKGLFDCVRDGILHGMPSGLLATKTPVTFDMGMWQHKEYGEGEDIHTNLKSKWTSHTINLLIVDDSTSAEVLKQFVTNCGFENKGRDIFLVYCIAIKSERVNNELADWLRTRQYPMNRYTNKVRCGDYTVFVCDFIKNLLLY